MQDVAKDFLLHECRRHAEVLEQVSLALYGAAVVEPQDRFAVNSTPEDSDTVLVGSFCNPQETLGGGCVQAVDHREVHYDEANALQGIVALPLHALHDRVAERLGGPEEEEAFEPRHQQPVLRQVPEAEVVCWRAPHVRCNLVAHQGLVPDQGRHLRDVQHEQAGRHEAADDDGQEQGACQDEARDDHQHLEPLHYREELPGAPEVLHEEAGPGEEEQS
mmetsp:Transcript_98658/g.260611  ORF Transcript_98658/g.260611 Transcript_98658/m.260611 type:complete len:219 (+) Transcript_98658:528-1184(+)